AICPERTIPDRFCTCFDIPCRGFCPDPNCSAICTARGWMCFPGPTSADAGDARPLDGGEAG
ncbi:MAG TPA: hypothetical protein VFH68_12020, partial [Polyangia bacterium]|nr:hypothetical protein [Polyangia bacterium]